MNNYIYIGGEKYIKAGCEECKKEKSPYEFEKYDKIYWLSADGFVVTRKTGYIDKFESELKQGNIFRTKEKAIHERDKRKAIFKIKKYIYDNFGYDPTDWVDGDDKYILMWHDNGWKKKFEIESFYNWKPCSPIGYLKTEDQAQEIIDNFEDELKIIFDI